MKRYWLFSGDDYYPCGGMQDFKDSFDSITEALESALKNFDVGFEWYHIYDSQERQVVSANRTTAEYCDRYNTDMDDRFAKLKNQQELK